MRATHAVRYIEAVVPAHHPFQFQQYGLAKHKRLAGFDKFARSLVLMHGSVITRILNVVARQNIGIKADHGFSQEDREM